MSVQTIGKPFKLLDGSILPFSIAARAGGLVLVYGHIGGEQKSENRRRRYRGSDHSLFAQHGACRPRQGKSERLGQDFDLAYGSQKFFRF